MDQFALALILIGGLTLLIGLLSVPLEYSWISPSLIGLFVGAVMGPVGLNLVVPSEWGDSTRIMHQVARLTLAIGLMGVALRLPAKSVWRLRKTLSLLLLVAMPISMLISTAAVFFLLELPLLSAALIGAAVCPTDPVVASSIVTGKVAEKNLPLRLRRTISAESGANDGLALPLVYLPLLLVERPWHEALPEWGTTIMLWQIGGAIGMGAAVGYVSSRLLRYSESCEAIESRSLLGFTLALTLLTLGLGSLIHVNDVLAVFVAGLAFDAGVSRHDRMREERIQETVNLFFSVPIFALLGAMIPLAEYSRMGFWGALLVLAVLVLRRLPVLLMMRCGLPGLQRSVDAAFAGWFGPIGVAALFYAADAELKTGRGEVWVVGSLLVVSSVIAHGVSASPLTLAYGRFRKQRTSSKSGDPDGSKGVAATSGSTP